MTGFVAKSQGHCKIAWLSSGPSFVLCVSIPLPGTKSNLSRIHATCATFAMFQSNARLTTCAAERVATVCRYTIDLIQRPLYVGNVVSRARIATNGVDMALTTLPMILSVYMM